MECSLAGLCLPDMLTFGKEPELRQERVSEEHHPPHFAPPLYRRGPDVRMRPATGKTRNDTNVTSDAGVEYLGR